MEKVFGQDICPSKAHFRFLFHSHSLSPREKFIAHSQILHPDVTAFQDTSAAELSSQFDCVPVRVHFIELSSWRRLFGPPGTAEPRGGLRFPQMSVLPSL
jgi:hypothetical protein